MVPSAQPTAHREASPRRRWLWPVLTLGLLGVLYVGAQIAVGVKDIPRGTKVVGIDVGGLSVTEAARVLNAQAPADDSIVVTVEGSEHSIAPRAAGLALDAEASARRAAGRPWTPWAVVAALTDSRDVEPVTTVDEAKLTAAVAGLQDRVESTFQEGGIAFAGVTPTAVEPVAGKTLDVNAAAERIRSGYLVSAEPIEVPLTEATPTISREEVQRALTEVAEPAVAAPIEVTSGRQSVTVAPTAIAAALSFRPESGRLQEVVDGEILRRQLGPDAATLAVKARDARFVIRNNKPVLVRAIVGRTVTPEGLADAVTSVLTDPAPRSARLALGAVQPKLTTAEAKALGITEKVGEFTTNHPCCAGRVTNIHRMADIVSGTIIRPGKAFDLNKIVGERDTARGFVPAPMIERGLFTQSVGGGVSQFATTMFNAAFFGGYPITEHKAHSYYISRYPPGREATVSFPKPDLIWQNDSEYGALVTASYTGTSITVTIWGKKRYDITAASSGMYRVRTRNEPVYNTRPDCSPAAGAAGFDIDVWRIYSVKGKELKREKFHTRYLAEPVIICGAKPAPKPKPTATPSPTGTAKPTPTATPTPKPTVSAQAPVKQP